MANDFALYCGLSPSTSSKLSVCKFLGINPPTETAKEEAEPQPVKKELDAELEEQAKDLPGSEAVAPL